MARVRRDPSGLPAVTEAPAPELSPHERRLRNRSILLAVVCPIVIVVWFPELGETATLLVAIAFWLAVPVYVLARPVYRWLLGGGSFLTCLGQDVRVGVPDGLAGEEGTAIKWPRTTVWLIATNVAVFCALDSDALTISNCEPSAWVYANWTSMFAHADWDHLFGNMVFLWAFGAGLEHRIGSRRLFLDYLAMGTLANAIGGIGSTLAGECAEGLGASGAISGVMGIYLVRCHFRRVAVGVISIGPVVYGLRVPAVALLTFFFLNDLLGAREQLAGSESDTDHWAHLGGYFCGLWLGFQRRYYRDGLREELAERMQAEPADADFGRRRSTRETLLAHVPDHVEALLSRARDACRFQPREEAARDYVRVIELLMPANRSRAAEIFLEYYRKYLRPLTLERQLALTSKLAARGELDVAARCLELAAKVPGADPALRARAQAYESRLLAALGLREAAPTRHPELDPSGE